MRRFIDASEFCWDQKHTQATCPFQLQKGFLFS
jgi:hypothetical protein